MSTIDRIRRARALTRERAVAAQAQPVQDWPLMEEGDFKALLHRQDSYAEESRQGTDRVHASTLTGEWCARRHAIFFRHGASLNTSSSPRSADRLLWTIGKAVEHHIRSSIIADLGPERCLGVWHCFCRMPADRSEYAGKMYSGFGGKQEKCTVCKSAPVNYAELSLSPHDVPVSGNPDLIYASDGNVLRPIEIKSKKLALFEALTAPDADHIAQVGLYIPLLRRVAPPGYSVDGMGHVIYGAKDYPRPGVSPYKDFVVSEPLNAEPSLLGAERDLGEILRGNANAPLPARLPACESPASSRAKRCGACTLCFQLR